MSHEARSAAAGELEARGSADELRDRLVRGDLHGADLRGADLRGASLRGADLRGANLFEADLRDADLGGADLSDAELTGADLRGAHLAGARAPQAGFGAADLSGASLFEADLVGGTLSRARLQDADLRCAHLREARLREADLAGADFTGADLSGADMSLCRVGGAVFSNASFKDTRMRAVQDFERAHWLGVDIRDVNFAGAYRMRRHIMDENYIKEYRESGPWAQVVYALWWATSDCGRSLGRWFLWIGLVSAAYAGLFSLVTVDYGPHPTWLSPLYFSVVTLTSLGFGEVVPASPAAQLLVMLEVVTGYVMLGGLLSIFSNKLARRAD